MNLYEVRSTGRRLVYPINLVKECDLHYYRGFRSVYGYPDETVRCIRENNGTYGLEGLPLYSNTLFLDFDDNDEAALQCAEDLKLYTYTMYNTGGRGYHFHIPIQPMLGLYIPETQKAWVTGNCPGADLSLYKTSGVIRLPGTWHAKNPGQYKRVVKENQGQVLHIKIKQPSAVPCVDEAGDADLSDLLNNMLWKVVRAGTVGRNQYAYKIACVCRDSGLSLQKTTRLVHLWSNSFCSPSLRYIELANTCKSAFKVRARA